jgi:uncharacterized membrane protein
MAIAFWTLWGLAWLLWLAWLAYDFVRIRPRRIAARKADELRQAEVAARYTRIEELLEEVQERIANRERGLVPTEERPRRRKISIRAAFAPTQSSERRQR